MYFKVKITKGLPQAKSGGFTGNNLNKQVISFGGADMNAASRHLENNRYLKEVPREEANLEAEKGESAFGDINGDGFTEHMLIGGKRHSQGGTALNLPDGTFIFSDTAAMKISDPEILAKFGKKSGSFTPAELAKPYDINKYRTILEDPNSDKVDKKSAELMIKNINLKLGALALAQEAKKGFPQGIPEVAQPYMQQMGIKEEDLIPQKAQPEAQIDQQAMQNPYENQGMGMQSPEEEMMEQDPGMQNPQEEMMEVPPMAQYGMAMGDYGSMGQVDPNQQFNSENNSDNSQSTGKGGFFSNLFGGNNKRRIKNKKNTVVNNYYGAPQQPATGSNNYNYYGASSSQSQSNPYAQSASNSVPQSTGENNFVNASLKTNQSTSATPTFSGASPRFSQGNFGANGYTPPTGYRDGGSLTRYQSKGEVKYKIPEGAVVINRGDYKTEEEYAKARNEQFAKAGKNPVYIFMPDGKYKKVTQTTKARDPYTGEDLKTTWNNSQDIADVFKDMNKSINTPEFTKILTDYTKKALKDEESYRLKSGKISKAYKNYSKKDFTPEEIRDAFALHQKRNLALQAYGIKARYFEDASTGKLLTPQQMVNDKILNDQGQPIKLDEAKKIYDKYKANNITDLKKAFDQVGIPLSDTALEQATFQGFTNALKDRDKLTPKEQAALTGWSGYETGVADERGQKNKRISPIDWDYTDTTGEQLSGYNAPTESELTDIDVKPEEPEAETNINPEEAPEPPYQGNPEWWLQDKVNMGLAASDYFDVQKALPWAARYEPELMTPTFYDPTRELAQQSEQANIANQALAQFTGPQALSARSASVQGQGAKQAADTLSRYNNQNVGVANQFEGNNAQIMNEAQRFNQAQNKQLYDQNVIANQQYKNTKRAFKHNLGQAYNTGVTNMMQTDAMNQMYPQYAVDPRSGGRMHFTKGKDGIPPTYNEDVLAYANKINASGLPEKVQAKMIDNYMQQHGGLESNGMPDMYGGVGKKSKKGGPVQLGYVMGSNVFPFMFT